MANPENDKFIRIALSLGFCSAAQIDECLKIQSSTSEHLSVGQSLLREGYISAEQYSIVLSAQRKGVHSKLAGQGTPRPAPVPARTVRGAEDELLGRLLVREGWITPEQAHDCETGDPSSGGRTFVEALIARGLIDPARLKELQVRLSKRPMDCPVCRVTFTVLSLARSRVVPCPKCRGPLVEGAAADLSKTTDSITTQTLRAVLPDVVGRKKPPAQSR